MDGQTYARSITAGGLTDILHPVQQSFGLLENVARERPNMFAVPVVFLMTVRARAFASSAQRASTDRLFVSYQDGAVPNEREVCKVGRKWVMHELPWVMVFVFCGIRSLCKRRSSLHASSPLASARCVTPTSCGCWLKLGVAIRSLRFDFAHCETISCV